MSSLMVALGSLGGIVLAGVVAHGAWQARKAGPKRAAEPGERHEPREPVFGDLDSHVLRGELKDPDGKTVRTLKHDVPSITRAGIRWRHTSWGFNLQNLAPAVYTLELTIDGGKPEKYSFTLK